MTTIVIFLILGVIAYSIAFANRDKSQDYKISPQVGYRRLVNEDKMRMDMAVNLDKLITRALIDAPSIGIRDRESVKLHLGLLINAYRDKCSNNAISLASTYRIPTHLTLSIIDEMCDGAYAEHVLER